MQYIKVMIVDDDYLVLEDLRSLVDWSALGFQIVAVAENGEKALQLYRKHTPQLLFCDICMPGMDGLELLERLRAEHGNAHVVVISSYDDFQYAKRALRADADDYILKNEITAESLTTILKRFRQNLQADAQKKSSLLRSLLSEFFTSDYTAEQFLQNNQWYQYTLRELENLLSRPLCWVAVTPRKCLRKSIPYAAPGKQPGAQLLASLKKCGLPPQVQTVFYTEDLLIVGCICPFGNRIKSLEMICSQIQELVGKENEKVALCYYSQIPSTLGTFRDNWNAQKPLLKFYHVFSRTSLTNLASLRGKAVFETTEQLDYFFMGKECRQHPERFCDALETYASKLFLNKDIENISRLFVNLITYYEEISCNSLRYDNAYYFDGLSDYLQFLTSEWFRCLNAGQAAPETACSNSTRKAMQYIDDNFSNADLSVEIIAEQVGISAGRLSALFRQELNTTVNDYLTKVRVNQAIYLLRETNAKIYEVAEMVGYNSSQYFSKVFFKRTGKKPIEYK